MKKIGFLAVAFSMLWSAGAQVKVNSNGDVGVGRDNPLYKLDINGTGFFGFRNTILNGTVVENGVIIGRYISNCMNYPATNYPAIYGTVHGLLLGTPDSWATATFSSSIYYRKNSLFECEPSEKVSLCNYRFVDAIKDIQIYQYEYKGTVPVGLTRDSSSEQIQEYCFSADELQTVFPQLVSVYDTCQGGDSIKKAISYIGMVPILTGAVREQQTLIEAQQDATELQAIRLDQMEEIAGSHQMRLDQHQIKIDQFGLQEDRLNQHQDRLNQHQDRLDQHQHQIEILQAVAFGQEFDITQLYELRERVENLQEDNIELRIMVNELRRIILRCCPEAADGARLLDTLVIMQDSNKYSNKGSQIQQIPVLYQNTPNPFSSNTEIACDIPTSFNSAVISVYNMQGVELMSFPITQTGYSAVIVYASTFPAGMYLYALVIDGVIIDTKRMILTK